MKVLQYERERTESEGVRSLQVPDSEVLERPKRRTYPMEYKLRILREADACVGDGDVGALLRREGLYFSHLSSWRRQRDNSILKEKKASGKQTQKDLRLKELERENKQLRRRLQKAEVLLDIQKKASELLGISLRVLDSEESE
jgi:transposase-like protein